MFVEFFQRVSDMKVYLLAAIIATSSTLTNAAEMPTAPAEKPTSTITARYIHHFKKMTPRPVILACGGQYSSCTSDKDCCVGWVCLNKKCE
jgi:hypothetical protein